MLAHCATLSPWLCTSSGKLLPHSAATLSQSSGDEQGRTVTPALLVVLVGFGICWLAILTLVGSVKSVT